MYKYTITEAFQFFRFPIGGLLKTPNESFYVRAIGGVMFTADAIKGLRKN